jgi:stalled ribosome alternative rescue factor ArfA
MKKSKEEPRRVSAAACMVQKPVFRCRKEASGRGRGAYRRVQGKAFLSDI